MVTSDRAERFDRRFREANDRILDERLIDALRILDDIAREARGVRDPDNEARGLRLAAGVARLLGDLPGAVKRGRRGARLEADPEVMLPLLVELAENEIAQGDVLTGVKTVDRALRMTAGDAPRTCALLRLQAAAYAHVGRTVDATDKLRAALELARDVGDPIAEARLLIESAGLLATAGSDQVDEYADRARVLALETDDQAMLAEIALFSCARSMDGGDPQTAIEHATTARRHALEGIAPLAYVSAALAEARLAEHLQDRGRAYRSLATGWVTLADLLGAEAAEASFAPELERLRDVWGPDAFDEVKRAYEHERRATLAAANER